MNVTLERRNTNLNRRFSRLLITAGLSTILLFGFMVAHRMANHHRIVARLDSLGMRLEYERTNLALLPDALESLIPNAFRRVASARATAAGMGDENVAAIVPLLRDLGGIEDLNLDKTMISDKSLPDLVTLNVSRMHLAATGISDSGLKSVSRMSRLQSLNLAHTNVTDAGLRHLHGMTTLRALGLRETFATPEGVDDLRSRLPRLSTDYTRRRPPTSHGPSAESSSR